MKTQLKQKDILPLKEEWYIEQKGMCPLLGQKIKFDKTVIDHDHDSGFCRGAIHFQANALEGKIKKAYYRTGCHKLVNLPDFLRNLADYLEQNKSSEKLIHPSEAPKKPKLKLRSYNKVLRLHGEKTPKYTGNLTEPLKKLFTKYEIEPEFYQSTKKPSSAQR